MKNLLFVISIAFPSISSALDRIQSMRFDRSQVQRIYLTPGLGSIVQFPCNLLEVFVGRSDDLKVQISPNEKKTLFLNLKLNSSLPTNVIAICFPEKNTFVFDVIPSRSKHQDLVEIRSTFGRLRRDQKIETEKQELRHSKLVLKYPKLIETGKSK